jgi:hypothetical protein
VEFKEDLYLPKLGDPDYFVGYLACISKSKETE